MIEKGLKVDFQVVLLDNGSLSPESTLKSRALAASLEKRIGQKVVSVSVSHSDRISWENLNREKAIIWKDYLESWKIGSSRVLMVLPLFFGPSFGLRKAVSLAAQLEKEFPDRRIHWGECLIGASQLDNGLVAILAKSVSQLLDTLTRAEESTLANVLLVDHGSPFSEVAQRRNRVAEGLRKRLGERVRGVTACSMERREGAEYDFNEPMLKEALASIKDRPRETPLILSQLFLFPGRHAGPGGDIESICDESEWVKRGGRILKTDLLGSNSLLIDLLQKRFEALLAKVSGKDG